MSPVTIEACADTAGSAEWQQVWRTRNSLEPPTTPRTPAALHALDMFPYPSGDLHLGHAVPSAAAT